MGKLLDKALGENKAYEEQLRREEEEAREIQPKSKVVNRKGGAPKRNMGISEQERCWETIERLSKSFCSIIEVPSLVSKLDEHTFRELVKSQLILFNCVNEKYWVGEGEDE